MPDAAKPPRTEAGQPFQPTIIGGHLQALQGFAPKIRVNSARKFRADRRDGSQDRFGMDLTPEALDHPQIAGLQYLHDRTCNRLSNRWKFDKSRQSLGSEDSPSFVRHPTDEFGRFAICANTKRIGALPRKEISHLGQFLGDEQVLDL